ncbi:MAG: tetratricopeptide repeat protein [Fimbriimonadia bacterium]|nr:tetratricopeptide repeat protein [Fimbriimonadia bacterium]
MKINWIDHWNSPLSDRVFNGFKECVTHKDSAALNALDNLLTVPSGFDPTSRKYQVFSGLCKCAQLALQLKSDDSPIQEKTRTIFLDGEDQTDSIIKEVIPQVDQHTWFDHFPRAMAIDAVCAFLSKPIKPQFEETFWLLTPEAGVILLKVAVIPKGTGQLYRNPVTMSLTDTDDEFDGSIQAARDFARNETNFLVDNCGYDVRWEIKRIERREGYESIQQVQGNSAGLPIALVFAKLGALMTPEEHVKIKLYRELKFEGIAASAALIGSDCSPISKEFEKLRKAYDGTTSPTKPQIVLFAKDQPGLDGLTQHVPGDDGHLDLFTTPDPVPEGIVLVQSVGHAARFIRKYQDFVFLKRNGYKNILPNTLFVPGYDVSLFVGDEHKAVVDQINTILTNHSQAYLCGEPGMGKTHTAHAFVEKYKDRFRATFWVNAADENVLTQSIIEVAVALGMKRDEGDTQSKVDFINTWLRYNPNALFVFDNARQTLREILELNLHLNEAKVLYTVWDHQAGSADTRVILESMSPEAGAELILKRAELEINDKNQQEAKNISQELGGLPLALDQAGFVIKSRKNLFDYLKGYRNDKRNLLNRRGGLPSGHPESVWVTYNQLLNLLESANAAAREWLNLFASMEPDNIPDTVLDQSLSMSDKADYIDLWRGLGLVRTSEDRKTGILLMSLHRLNHEILNILLRKSGAEQNAVKRAVGALLSAFPDSEGPTLWDTCALYSPHAIYAAGRAADLGLRTGEVASLLGTAGTYLNRVRRLDEAVSAYEDALTIRRDLAEEQPAVYTPDVAMTLNNLGNALGDLRRLDEALAAYEEALRLYRALAQEQPAVYLPNVATTLNNLGNALQNLLRLDEALAAYEDALVLYRALAEEQPAVYTPDVAMTLNNLGVALQNLLRLDEAVSAYEDALVLYRALAQEQPAVYLPNVAGTLNNLGNALQNLLRLDEALAAYEEALRLYRALAQEQPAVYTPDVAMTLNNLGNALGDLRRQDEALAAYEEALTIRRALAEEQPAVYLPNVATTLHNLGVALRALRRLDEAVSAYEEALCLLLRAPYFGLEHPWTQTTMRGMYHTYLEQGLSEEDAIGSIMRFVNRVMETDEPCGKS